MIPVEDDDPERCVLNQRIQVAGLLVKLSSNPVPFADCRSDDQTGERDHQHQDANLRQRAWVRREYSQRNYDPKIQGQDSGGRAPDAMAHSNPENWDKAQVEELQRPQGASKHDPKQQDDARALSNRLRAHDNPQARVTFLWPLGPRRRLRDGKQDLASSPGEYMNEQKGRHAP